MQSKAKETKTNKDLLISYDKFKDKSIISTKPQDMIGAWEGASAIVASGMVGPAAGPAQTRLILLIGYEFKGDKLDRTPDMFSVLFSSISHDFVYLKGDKNLYVLFDDQRLELHPEASDADIKWTLDSMGGTSEWIGFDISRDDLEKLVTAKKVEFKLGDTRSRKWWPEWSKRIQSLLTITKI